MKNTLIRLTCLTFLFASFSTAFGQDPVLDKKIEESDKRIADLEQVIADTEELMKLVQNGRTFLMKQDYTSGVILYVPISRETFTKRITEGVLIGKLSLDDAAKMIKSAVAISKSMIPAITDELKSSQKELQLEKAYYRMLIDERQKQNEATMRPNLSGAWESNYYGSWQGTTIVQSGDKLTFTNEKGDSSPGEFISSTQIKATKWEGGLTATIESPNRIVWSNGCIWRRKGT